MFASQLPPIYDKLLNFLVSKATPAEILSFELTAKEAKYLEALTEKNKSGHLTEVEAAELEQIMEIELLIASLRARAFAALKQKPERFKYSA